MQSAIGAMPRSGKRHFQKDQKTGLEREERECDRAGESLGAPTQERESCEHEDRAGGFYSQKYRRASVIDLDQIKPNGVLLKVFDHVACADDKIAVVERNSADEQQSAGKERSPAVRIVDRRRVRRLSDC